MATRPRCGQAPFETHSGLAGHSPENHGPSLFDAVEMLKNLAIIAVSIALIVPGDLVGATGSVQPDLFQTV